MANHLRQLRGGRVSFFLFMDTITAVTAMLIMVALMMTLYMGGSPVFPLSPSSSTRPWISVSKPGHKALNSRANFR